MLPINKLQRKVLLVVLLIILFPMLISSSLSALWVTGRINHAIAQRLRESAQLDSDTFARLHKNARLFVRTLSQVDPTWHAYTPGHAPVPASLAPLAKTLGISLVQVVDAQGRQVYSSPDAHVISSWPKNTKSALVKVKLDGRHLLASINILPLGKQQPSRYRLVLGTLLDRALLARLSSASGLKVRLYYPDRGDFTNAFSEEEKPLKLQLPPAAYARLLREKDYFSADAEGGRYWGLYTPVIDAAGKVEAILFTGEPRAGTNRLLSDLGILLLVIIITGTILALITGLLLGQILVRPVRELHQGVMRVAAQDFRTSLPVTSHDELGELAQSFNAMAESLRVARDEQHRDFQRDKLSALGELAMGMAHEIRNPIGTITTASGLLQTTRDEARQLQLREAIHEASKRLDQLLNDFQQLARHHPPQFQAIDPAAPLDKILSQMLASHDDIKLVRHYRHGDRQVLADEDLLQQAWANLVSNALEAMADEPGELEAGSVVESDAVLIYLQDSGPGIPPTKVPRLFEPFYTSKTKGSGLGLTIAASLVEANGGQLEYVPSNGRGARFAMRLPFNPGEAS